MKITMFAHFKEYHGIVLYPYKRLKIRDVCMDFEPYFKVHNLVSVHPKSIILGQIINLLDMFFHHHMKLAPVPC